MDQPAGSLNTVVKGVIEGETRILAAAMTIEEIFRDRVQFKSTIVRGIDDELRKFGLTVWTANVKDLQDTTGSEYFQYLRKKTVETAGNQAKIDVSEARMKGDIGEKQRQGETRTEVAKIEAAAVLRENDRKAAIAQSIAELRVKQAETEQVAKLAEIGSKQVRIRAPLYRAVCFAPNTSSMLRPAGDVAQRCGAGDNLTAEESYRRNGASAWNTAV
jgi:flotillin